MWEDQDHIMLFKNFFRCICRANLNHIVDFLQFVYLISLVIYITMSTRNVMH